MIKPQKLREDQAAIEAAMAAFLAQGKTAQVVAPQPTPKARTAQ